MVCKITVKKKAPKVTKTPVNTPTTSPSMRQRQRKCRQLNRDLATATAEPQDNTPAMKEIFKG
ncbi:MAG: hypothetical protein ACLSD6_00090 [Clostridium sp.]